MHDNPLPPIILPHPPNKEGVTQAIQYLMVADSDLLTQGWKSLPSSTRDNLKKKLFKLVMF